MKYVFLIFGSLIIIFGVTFATLNAHDVTIHFYFNQTDLPLSLLLVITLVVGILLGLILMLSVFFRAKREVRRLKSRIRSIELEVNNLRTIPLKESP